MYFWIVRLLKQRYDRFKRNNMKLGKPFKNQNVDFFL